VAQPTTAADQDVVLLADGIDLIRDSRLLLDQVSFTVRAGENWALLGPNGAGKSTLLRLLATYAHPTNGRVDILGRRLGRVDVFTLRPLIALVSSHQPVYAARTVRELALTGVTGTTDLRARWTPGAADLRRAEAAIEVMGLGPVAGIRWSILSQGERSRALIARAWPDSRRCCCSTSQRPGLTSPGASSCSPASTTCANATRHSPPSSSRTIWRSCQPPRRTLCCCVMAGCWRPVRLPKC
jgi:iron complex transport system ATP-binding protein